jgi:hypothetical protein
MLLVVRLRRRRFIPEVMALLAVGATLLWTHYLFAVWLPALVLAGWFLPIGRPSAAGTARLPDGDRSGAETRSKAHSGFRSGGLSGLGLMICLGVVGIALVPLLPQLETIWSRKDALNWFTEHRPLHRQFETLTGELPERLTADTVSAALLGPWRALAAAGSVGQAWVALRAALIPVGLVLLTLVALLRGALSRRGTSSSTAGSRRVWLAMIAWYAGPILLLWAASRWLSPSLAQPRYTSIQILPAALLLAGFLRVAVGPRWLAATVVAVILVGPGPARVVEHLRHPSRHDLWWKDAADWIDAEARPGDLVFVQTGLVETQLVPALHGDAGFQEYVTSRLGPFYRRTPLTVLSLPRFMSDGPWRSAYAERIRATRAAGGRVFLIFSADSDIGEAMERQTTLWLASLGPPPKLERDIRVARAWSVRDP